MLMLAVAGAGHGRQRAEFRAGDGFGARPGDIGKVTSIDGGRRKHLGFCAPIVTGYVVSLTGNFDRAFVVAGLLPLAGAAATFLMTRKPIEPHQRT